MSQPRTSDPRSPHHAGALVEPSNQGLFARESTKRALEKVAGAPNLPLTIVVGSGVSMGSRLPDWRALATRCLERLTQDLDARAYPAQPTTRERIRSVCDVVVDSEGLIAAMELARSFVPASQFVARMSDALYSDAFYSPKPNAAHYAIIDLAHSWSDINHRPAVILTTNYDPLLLTASIESGFAAGAYVHDDIPDSVASASTTQELIRSSCQFFAGDSEGVPIVHLHGSLPPEGGLKGMLIASEYDYLGKTGVRLARLQEAIFRKARSGLTLFIGTSLADPRLVRLILGTTKQGPAIAVLSAQGFKWISGSSAPQMDVIRAWQHTYGTKWKRAGVELVWTDYFSQMTQFAHEVNPRSEHRSADGSSVVSYGQRISEWHQQFRSFPKRMEGVSVSVIDTPDSEANSVGEEKVAVVQYEEWVKEAEDGDIFRLQQEAFQDSLTEGVKEFKDRIVELCPGMDVLTERFKLDLWIRYPEQRALVRFASSEAMFPSFDALLAASIPKDDDYAVVRAFRSGSAEIDEGSGRWRTFVCEPISIPESGPEHAYGSLPVGVVVLASSHSMQESILADPAVDFADVRELLLTVGLAALQVGSTQG